MEEIEREDINTTQDVTKADFEGIHESALSSFMANDLNAPLLEAEEEIRLINLIRGGDKVAYNTFLEANLRLVVSVAKRFRYTGVPLEDLISEGNLGLMKAIDKFDVIRGTRFSTPAVHWIRQSIQLGLVKMRRMVSWPLHFEVLYASYKKLEKEYLKSHAHLSDGIIMDELNLSQSQVDHLKKINVYCDSIDVSLYESDGDDRTMGDLLCCEDELNEDSFAKGKAKDAITALMECALNKRECMVLSLRFGLSGSVETLDSIAQMLGVTVERVRQIERKALERLHAACSQRNLLLSDLL